MKFFLQSWAWRAALLAAFLGWLAAPAAPVQAHAQLVSSNPAPGQALAQFPAEVQLDFSEAVYLESARVNLVNASGEIVAEGKVRESPTSPRTLFVDLPTQPDGVYSLNWYVVSSVDGHDTGGSIAFSVGLTSPKASLLPPPGTPDPAATLPPAAELIFRALTYMSLALALGAAAFAMLTWRPAYQETVGEQPPAAAMVTTPTRDEPPTAAAVWDSQVSGLLKGLILFGSIGVLVCMAGVLIWQSLQITPEQAAPVWQTLLTNFSYHEGGFVWIRLLLLPLMAVLAIRLPPAGSGLARPWWEIAGLGMLVELTYSLSGHSAAFGTPFPILGDWLHFTAVSFWLGGLVPLGTMLLHRRFRGLADGGVLLDRAARHFSSMAFISVIVLALSGVYSAYLQVRSLPVLVGTRYGQAVLVKAGLLALLVGLGALNQLGILPSIARQGARAIRRLGRSVRVELVLGALALLAAGALASLAPGYDALRANQRMGLRERWQGDGVRMDFRVAPVQVGDNEFGVEIADSRPGAEKVNGTALLRIQAADESTGQVQVEARLSAGQRYTARGSYLSKMGAWDVLVIWRKNGFNDVTHVFTVDLARWAEQTGQKINPVPPDSASILAGRALYLENCAACHGITGKGDGPSGHALNPTPSDLTQHALPGVHSDGQLFDWITAGFPGSAMPAFEDQLTEKQRWDLVNFIRTLPTDLGTD